MPGGWIVLTCPDTVPEQEWLPALMQATGSPVMWCTISVMDAVQVRGLSQAGDDHGSRHLNDLLMLLRVTDKAVV